MYLSKKMRRKGRREGEGDVGASPSATTITKHRDPFY
jgi:hypothetical protein